MPTQLPYLKGTSQFLTTGGEKEEENFFQLEWKRDSAFPASPTEGDNNK